MDHDNMFFLCSAFPIGMTRCTFSDISTIIGKRYNMYNVLCFHRYFGVMLFFIGNSQCFCISWKFPTAVSQLFFLFQPSHGASLNTSVGWRQLLIANQAFCLDGALRERCDVRWTLLHPTPPHHITSPWSLIFLSLLDCMMPGLGHLLGKVQNPALDQLAAGLRENTARHQNQKACCKRSIAENA